MRRAIREAALDSDAAEAADAIVRETTLQARAMSAAPMAARAGFLVFVAATYIVAALYMGGLGFDPVKDEEQFWEQISGFVAVWPPGLAEIQNYDEPMTPLSFLFWAGLERMHGLGIGAARFISILLGIGLLSLIGFRSSSPATGRYTPLFSALALIAFPYWVPLSLLLYTDLPATIFIVSGVLFYFRKRDGWAALFFVLAIATRQYMVVFPAAIVAHEGIRALRGGDMRFLRCWPYALAAATLLGWIAFFGGVGPADGLAEWPRHQNALDRVNLAFSLYFLAATGAYFVLPEWAIDRYQEKPKLSLGAPALAGLAVLLVAFLIDTPNYAKEVGPLNRSIAFVLNPMPFADWARPVLMFALASLTVVRFARFDVASWIVLANAVLMAFMWSPWEKYCMPMLGGLWMLKALGALEANEAADAADDPETQLEPEDAAA